MFKTRPTNASNASNIASDLTKMTDADPKTLAAYYDQWAESYDRDLPKMGYDTPVRAAAIMVE